MDTHITKPHKGSGTRTMTDPAPGRNPVFALPMQVLRAAALLLPAFGAHAAVALTTIHSFHVLINGAYPEAGLAQGDDANLYGTTSGGGTNGAGTVFKITRDGTLTSLYSFTGGNDGADPTAGLVQGGDGNFYSTTGYGGTNGAGTVFKISTNGALTSLHSFTGGDGANPLAGPVQGSDGNFYGTTRAGGASSHGTVFKIGPNGALTSLYSFTGANDGEYPVAGLVEASDGYLYGTTQSGGLTNVNDNGTRGHGTVFKISTNGELTSLYFFTGGNDGADPSAALVQGSDGYLYGTTRGGGANSFNLGGFGTVFKISLDGVLTSLYSFGDSLDGGYPVSGLVQGSDGSFYGTSSGQSTSALLPSDGHGIVFKISTNGALTTLWSFSGLEDGAVPVAGLVQGRDGNLYGTTTQGGGDHGIDSLGPGFGNVFQISTNGVLTNLYLFTPGNDGGGSQSGLVQGRDGFLYGTTVDSGTNGKGTVFKISAGGVYTNLYSFAGGQDGAYPNAPVQGSDGYLYGTTSDGGINGNGTVFRITTNGELKSLHLFTGSNDGSKPLGALVQGSDGYLYGTTQYGSIGLGTVFKISTTGVLATLHAFTGGDDGWVPQAGLVQGSDGSFYGTTSGSGARHNGSVFKISSNGALTPLHSLAGTEGDPEAGLTQGADGYLYGTTPSDYGNPNYGTLFKISTNGALTTLYSFTGGNDGGSPWAELVEGSDGNLYGTTLDTVFQVTPGGALKTLLAGFFFSSGLVQGSDGYFYGTTRDGGEDEVGSVFRLTILPEFQAVILANGTPTLTWATEARRTYQPQFSSDLGSSNWTNLGGPLTATGATLSRTDSVTNGPLRFYRVVLSP